MCRLDHDHLPGFPSDTVIPARFHTALRAAAAAAATTLALALAAFRPASGALASSRCFPHDILRDHEVGPIRPLRWRWW